MSPSRRLKIWERSGGICCLCGRRIDGTREPWYVEHLRALELGGEDSDDNCGPAHLTHKSTKDADDHSRAAKAKRQKQRVLGIRKASRPMPGSRSSKFKRKIDGSVVRRDED